jgi:protein TonB
VSARPIAGPALEYPPAMQDAQREGRVVVACDVGTDGNTHNCAIETVQGGAAFGSAALKWVQNARYRPAIHNGVPVAEPHHAFNITFKLNSDDE